MEVLMLKGIFHLKMCPGGWNGGTEGKASAWHSLASDGPQLDPPESHMVFASQEQFLSV